MNEQETATQQENEQTVLESENTKTEQAKSMQNPPAHAMSAKKRTIQILILIATGFVNALAMHAFIIPNGFVTGGVSGFAMIFSYLSGGWNTGIFLAMLNTPLIIISFLFIGKKFALKTTITVIASSFFLWLLGFLNVPVYISSDSKLLPAAAGGVIAGLNLAVILKNGSSSGGMDVIATIIQKKRADVNIAWFILALDMTSIIVSVFVFTQNGAFSLEPLILAIAYKFVSAKACEAVLQGLKSAMKFEIVTTHPEEVSREIMDRLHRGVTMLQGTGMYSKEGKALLICVIRRRELSFLQKIVKKYPDTFCYISSTSDVMGKF